MTYPNGSEWRRWDLHIHTPLTKKEDRFTGTTEDEKWANYVEAINNYPDEIAAIGITDYFSIDGYFRFRREQREGRITKQIPLVIPNVELRIHPVAKDGQGVNLHILFDPAIADQIQERFLNKLKFAGDDRPYTASSQDLKQFGRMLRDDEELDDFAALRAGIAGYIVSIDCIRDIFKHDQALRNECIIVVANGNDGLSGVRQREDAKAAGQMSQVEGLVDSIYQFSDAVFSGNPGDAAFFLGKKSLNLEALRRRYGSVMPCFHGSDAHALDDIFEPAQQRYCWIKADPTFNGLRQTLDEPALRVHIGPTKPGGKVPYQTIDHVVTGNPGFANTTVNLNQDLTCIVGGRSTGKSLFLAMVAKKLQPTATIKPHSERYDEFVSEVAREAKVVWADGAENNDREIEYFFQGYMNKFSRDPEEFDQLVQSIITADLTDDPIAAYDAFVASNRSAILDRLTELERLRKEVLLKHQEQKSIGDVAGIKAELERLNKRRDELRAIHKISEAEFTAFSQLSDERKQNAVRRQTLTNEASRLATLTAPVLRRPEIVNLLESSRSVLTEALKEGEAKAVAIWQAAIKKLQENVRAEAETLTLRDQEIAADSTYQKGLKATEGSTALKEIEAALGLQTERKLNYEKLTADLVEMSNQESSLRKAILELNKAYFLQAEGAAADLNSKMIDGELTIQARPQVVVSAYNESLSEGINLKSYARQEAAVFAPVTDDKQEYFLEVEDKLSQVLNDGLKFKNNYTTFKFLRRIIGECYVRISYDVTYDGDEYARMSEGKQAFVVLRLLLDFSKKTCPILIDQPEDDLDNRAIYTDLVKYLRTKKAERQIILVTHNPNIVVGTDAELVVVANQHGIRTPNEGGVKFQYLSGSIENSAAKDQSVTVELESQGIREHICEVLEGGTEAFKARERRYRIGG